MLKNKDKNNDNDNLLFFCVMTGTIPEMSFIFFQGRNKKNLYIDKQLTFTALLWEYVRSKKKMFNTIGNS